jgi:hypothetical protein
MDNGNHDVGCTYIKGGVEVFICEMMMMMWDENLTIEEPVNDVSLAGPHGDIYILILYIVFFLLLVLYIV